MLVLVVIVLFLIPGGGKEEPQTKVPPKHVETPEPARDPREAEAVWETARAIITITKHEGLVRAMGGAQVLASLELALSDARAGMHATPRSPHRHN